MEVILWGFISGHFVGLKESTVRGWYERLIRQTATSVDGCLGGGIGGSCPLWQRAKDEEENEENVDIDSS